MKPRFLCVAPADWDSAVRIARRWTQSATRNWAYRGQAKADWRLETALKRACHDLGCDQLLRREAWMIRQFQRRAHHYLASPPPTERRLEWVALMQHHGAPSRLIDFTYSFYVASVFAIRSVDVDSAVWAVNLALLRERTREALGIPGGSTFAYVAGCTDVADKLLGRPLWRPADDRLRRSILCGEPTRLNERISAQQGLFLLPTDLDCSFEQNLAAVFGHDLAHDEPLPLETVPAGADIDQSATAAVKIVLPKAKAKEAIAELKEMNLHDGTLFPGLDGFARSLRAFLSNPWPEPPYWTDEDDAILERHPVR
jgi:hypothetical protein